MSKCCVWVTLLRGIEIRTLNSVDIFEALELWMYRRMLKISWTQRQMVLSRMNRLINRFFLKKRKLKFCIFNPTLGGCGELKKKGKIALMKTPLRKLWLLQDFFIPSVLKFEF